MLYRCLSLMFLVLLLGACREVFSSGRYPKDMPPLSEFANEAMAIGPCGFEETLKKYTKTVDKFEGKSEIWLALYKERNTYPYLLARTYVNHGFKVLTEYWIYKSSSGDAEFIENQEEFAKKYNQPCQAVGGTLQNRQSRR
jgi:hypothetical protein